MCADWAVFTGAIKEREHAHTSIESALNFATSAGQSFTQTALNWIARHQTVSVTQ
ncbi:MAG: hypothetical protein PUP92_16010 [Rhizonema sp. PD38]|nr:hypothetical protein [Rhizonema sp. PD38]